MAYRLRCSDCTTTSDRIDDVGLHCPEEGNGCEGKLRYDLKPDPHKDMHGLKWNLDGSRLR
jgi:hypothetical protein